MNFFQYCEDEALKVKVEGMPIHRFFAPEGFIQWGLEPALGNYNGYAQIVDMPIDEYLGLAEPIPEDDLVRHESIENFKNDVTGGKITRWDIPYLVIQENEDGIWKVIGHDGRHRGMLLKQLNYSSMPVLIKIPDHELNEELLPDILWCQNDKSVEREKDFWDFPINEDNFKKPYMSIGNGVAVVGHGENATIVAMDEIEYGLGCDAPNLKKYLGTVNAEDGHDEKRFMGKAPISCTSAKKNFAKNFVANVAYRGDNTMPASNLKEYLEKKGK